MKTLGVVANSSEAVRGSTAQAKREDLCVRKGDTVVLEGEDGSKMTVVISTLEQVNPTKDSPVRVATVESRWGKALAGNTIGSNVEIEAPAKTFRLKILEIIRPVNGKTIQ